MENLDFQILLTDNYYTNPNSMHLCFPMKIKKATNKAADIDDNMMKDADIDDDLKTVNNFCELLIKEISVTNYGNNKQLISTFSPYPDAMLKYLPKDFFKKSQKMLLYAITKQQQIEEQQYSKQHNRLKHKQEVTKI